MHLGKWSDPRRNALAASVLALSCQKSPTFAKRDTTLEIASLKNCPKDVRSQRQFVCRRLLVSGQSMHQFKDSFFLCCQPSRLVFVEIQWTAKFDQQVRCFRHSPLCFWITLEKSHSSRFRRAVWFGCHRKHGFCSFREGHTHLLLQGSPKQQSTKYPPRLVAFIAGFMTHLRLVLREPRFWRRVFGGPTVSSLFVVRQTSPDSALAS